MRVDDEARRGPGEPEARRARGQRRLLAHALREVRVRPLQPLGDHAGDTFDLGFEPLVDAQLEPGDLRDDLDGAIVVGRPETARARDEVGRDERVPQRRLELVGIVSDDLDSRRLEPERRAGSGRETVRSDRCARLARARCR